METKEIICNDCSGEGKYYNNCPFCGEESVREHHDAGTYCTDCGSLEGLSDSDYEDCDTCEGKGFLNADDMAFNRAYDKADRQNKQGQEA